MHHDHAKPSFVRASSIDDIIDRLVKAVHDGDIIPGYIDTELLREFTSMFRSAITEGYDQGVVDYDTPDFRTLIYLQNNVAAFSAAKDYDLLKQMNSLLLDEAGKRRSLRDFREQVDKLNLEYNVRYLETEYNNAFANAQMARQWNDYAANDAYTNITVRTAGDERVRAKHQQYEGFTRPKTDPVWQSFWPPFDWACRCDTDESNALEFGAVDIKEIPTMFRNNSGISGTAFDSSHPYFRSMKEDLPKNKINAIALAELNAVKNYGMDSVADIYKRGIDLKLPEEVDFEDYWRVLLSTRRWLNNDAIVARDRTGMQVMVQREVVNGNRNINSLIGVIQLPDEVWLQRGERRVYIKYYNDCAMVMRTNKECAATSFDKVKIKYLEELRTGVLLHS